MIIYTDGSCLGNGKSKNSGGFGIVVLDNNENLLYTYNKRNENTTNNREEIRAILYSFLNYGVISFSNYQEIPIVYSDSNYCIQTFNTWMFNWANNNWIKSDKKQPENLDLIKVYYDWYKKGYRIDLRKVKGHSNNEWNQMADDLATGKIKGMNNGYLDNTY